MSSQERFEECRRIWSKHYGYELSDDEVEEIIQNLTNFCEVLLEIDREQSQGQD